jgi:hypothetical protein
MPAIGSRSTVGNGATSYDTTRHRPFGALDRRSPRCSHRPMSGLPNFTLNVAALEQRTR